MNKLATLILLASSATAISAQTFGLHVGSWHSEPGYNNSNPGVYGSTADGWTAGTYYNSIRRQSAYAGWTGRRDVNAYVSAEVALGLVTGYKVAPVLPLVAPSVVLHGTSGPAARITVLPKFFDAQGASVVHLSLEWKL